MSEVGDVKRVRMLVVVAIAPLLLGGCHHLNPFASSNKACHKPQRYMKARDVAPLKIPEGMEAPDSTGALRLPQLNQPAPPARSGKDPCLDEPPPFKVAKTTPQR